MTFYCLICEMRLSRPSKFVRHAVEVHGGPRRSVERAVTEAPWSSRVELFKRGPFIQVGYNLALPE